MGAILAAVVSVLAAAATWIRSVQVQRQQQRTNIESALNKSIELAIAYPHLEQDSYCSAWPSPPGDQEQRERYDNYCCFVFNTIERAWLLEKRCPTATAALVPVRESAWRHRRWWSSEDENDAGYHPDFVKYLDDIVIEEYKKRGTKCSVQRS